ncbi:hypothetical protein CPB97_006608 [Podila verticillata]|nr:hypothetical protein CPB97_006608 [Podila verticillata]
MARAHNPATPHLAGLTFYSLLLCLFSLAHTVLGQTPSPVQEMAFARAGPLLYVQGGKIDSNGVLQTITNQLYALDLSKSWATTAAPWISLAAGDANFLFNAVAAPDNQSIYTIATAANNAFSFKKYNIPTNTWDPNPFLSGTSNQIRQATRPVVDPRTGLVYLTDTNYMNIFNVVSGAMDSSLIPSNALTSRRFMGSVYNAARQSIMFYGGLGFNGTVDPLATYVTEYNIGLQGWSNFTTTGTPPVSRSDFCMASSEDGNKVVVYGGRIPLNNSATPPIDYTDTFHILDIPTGQWTQGPSGSPRLYMACVIVGDQFVAWGGARGGGNTYSSTPPVVFDLTKGQWVDKYTAPSYLLNGPHPTTTGPASATGTPQPGPGPGAPESKSSNNNLGAILGGVFGSLFVITVAGLIYMFFLRRQDKVKYSIPSDQKPGGDASDDNNNNNNNNNNNSSSESGPEVLQTPPTSFMSSVFTYQQQNGSQQSQPRNPQHLLPKTSELEPRVPQAPQDLSSLQMKHTPKVDGPVYALVNNTPQPPTAPQHIHVYNPVVTSVPSVNYGYVAPAANNTPVYHPQSGYPMPGQLGVTMAASQPTNVVYVAHPTPPLDYSNTNTNVFDTTLASQGSNPSTQYGYTSDSYATRSTQLSPTTTQVYYVPSTTAATGHPSGVPVSVAYSQGPVGQGYGATSPVASSTPTGAHYYTAHVPGFGPSYTSDVNVHVPSTQP